eukprot:m.50749 g.50749  ORF g.50749 m.50749 type:complete len:439 (-) comp21342_c0_seq1:14-1330(-)
MEKDPYGDWKPRPRPCTDGVSFEFSTNGTGCRVMSEVYQRDEMMMGKGTFGEVFKARVKDSSDSVAMKKLVPGKYYAAQGFPLTALREIMMLLRLKHPNIVDFKEIVFDKNYVKVGSADTHHAAGFYIVMGYMEHDLGGLLKRGTRFDVPQLLCLTKQMLQGLVYLHSLDIMHRDMKAANVLVDKNGRLRLTDFGLARYSDVAGDSKYTPERVVTRWYRPPEILLGESKYTQTVDTWGAACIVAELVVGVPILQGKSEDSEEGCSINQFLAICETCGSPTETPGTNRTWPGFKKLKNRAGFTPKKVYERKIRTTLWERMTREYKRNFDVEVFEKIKEPLLNFMDASLKLDPAARLTAKKALLHPVFYLRDFRPCEENEVKLPGQSSHDYTVQIEQKNERKLNAASRNSHQGGRTQLKSRASSSSTSSVEDSARKRHRP